MLEAAMQSGMGSTSLNFASLLSDGNDNSMINKLRIIHAHSSRF
jgi:hypothetical protein